MRQIAVILILAIGVAHAQPPLALSISLSTDRPQPGADFTATVVIFDGSGDVQVSMDLPTGVELAAPVPVIHAVPVGLAVVRLHVRSDATVGARTLRFRAGGVEVRKTIYVGVYPWPRATFAVVRRLPIVRR